MTEPTQILERGPQDEQTVEQWFREIAESMEEVLPTPYDEERVEWMVSMLEDSYVGDGTTSD